MLNSKILILSVQDCLEGRIVEALGPGPYCYDTMVVKSHAGRSIASDKENKLIDLTKIFDSSEHFVGKKAIDVNLCGRYGSRVHVY